MGYDAKEILISVRLSRHNDERDERDNKLAKELEAEVREIAENPRYKNIALFYGLGLYS